MTKTTETSPADTAAETPVFVVSTLIPGDEAPTVRVFATEAAADDHARSILETEAGQEAGYRSDEGRGGVVYGDGHGGESRLVRATLETAVA